MPRVPVVCMPMLLVFECLPAWWPSRVTRTSGRGQVGGSGTLSTMNISAMCNLGRMLRGGPCFGLEGWEGNLEVELLVVEKEEGDKRQAPKWIGWLSYSGTRLEAQGSSDPIATRTLSIQPVETVRVQTTRHWVRADLLQSIVKTEVDLKNAEPLSISLIPYYLLHLDRKSRKKKSYTYCLHHACRIGNFFVKL